MDNNNEPPAGNPAFSATRWTVIYAARNDSPEALEILCQRYWRPLYVFAARDHTREEAEDLVQGFFCELLSKDSLKKVAPEKGKFRSFLLTCFKNYASNMRDRESTLKRGGGVTILPLELENSEGTYTIEPVDNLTPEKLYLRQWAMTLFGNVLAEVADEYKGRSEIFQAIIPFLGKEGDGPYREAAAKLEMSETAFKQAVFRLKKFHSDRLEIAVEQTLSPGEDVDQEIKELFAALS